MADDGVPPRGHVALPPALLRPLEDLELERPRDPALLGPLEDQLAGRAEDRRAL